MIATQLAATTTGLDVWHLVMDAGPMAKLVLLILLGFSVASWGIMAERFRRFRRAETGSLAVARQQIRRLEAQARRLQAIAELEKQEKMILIEDMNTMHRAQKEQIEQDRRHLQQMDETNEQLCQDLIQAEAELTLLRSSSRRDAGAAGGASGAVDADDEFDVDEPSGSASKAAVAGLAGVAGVMTTPPRQSSAEMEAALAWQEKAALEEVLADTQRQLGAHPLPPFATLPSLSLFHPFLLFSQPWLRH